MGVCSAAALFTALTSAREAAADPLGIEVAARGGVGGSSGPSAFGLGLPAGASIGSVYFGATLLWGVEFGYDFKPLTWLTIRPEIGAGFASVSGTCSAPLASSSRPLNAQVGVRF